MTDQQQTNLNARQAAGRMIDAAIPTSGPEARDWAGFFAGLAELAKVLLPIILPLFLNPQPTPPAPK